MRNPHRPPECSAKIILTVARLVNPKEVVVPGIRVQRLIAEKFEDAAVIAVSSGFGGEAFHSTRRMSVLCGRGCGRDFEFGERFNRGSCLIEGSARVRTLHAGTIQQDLRTEILST